MENKINLKASRFYVRKPVRKMTSDERKTFVENYVAHNYREYEAQERRGIFQCLHKAVEWGFKSSYTDKELKAMKEQQREREKQTNQEDDCEQQNPTFVRHIKATELF